MAILRTGEHPLAGQDPLTDCFEDPAICTDQYALRRIRSASGIANGLGAGNSGGTRMILEEAGPAQERRTSVRPALDDGTPGFLHRL